MLRDVGRWRMVAGRMLRRVIRHVSTGQLVSRAHRTMVLYPMVISCIAQYARRAIAPRTLAAPDTA
eukprot:479040-Rhodomonas_salina.5